MGPNKNDSGILAETGWEVYPFIMGGGPYYMHWRIEGENYSYSRYWYGEWEENLLSEKWSHSHQALKGGGKYDGVINTSETNGSFIMGGPSYNNICWAGSSTAYTTVP